MSESLGDGGHFVLRPMGRLFLDRFEPLKHSFTGTEDGAIKLPRRATPRDDATGVENRVFEISR